MIPPVKNIITYLFLLLLLLGTESCIREDYSDCIRGLYIYFKPENDKHNYPDLVHTVNLYFYDETGYLAAGFSYSKEELSLNDRAAFVENLPPGKYTLVSIINNVESYCTIEEQQLKSLQSYLKESVIDYPLIDFFSGTKEITVNPHAWQQKEITEIFKHNNDIRVEIVFDEYELPPGCILSTYIEGNNGAYHYNSGTCPEGNVITYLPYLTERDKNSIPIASEFTVMRLWRNADLTLTLQEEMPSEGMSRKIQLNIADELAKVVNEQNEFLYDTDEKLSFNDEYKIIITLGPDLILLQLTINDWAIIGGGVGV